MYKQMVKMVSIDVAEFLAIVIGIIFYIVKMVPFINAAFKLGYVNGVTLSYAVYTLLLILLPIVLLSRMKRINKAVVLRYIFYTFSALIVIGTVSDLILFNGFSGYTYKEGDAIFVNLLWNMPNLNGVLMSCIVAILYFFLGKQIKRRRTYSYFLYLSVFLMSHVPTYIYTWAAQGTLPRDTYLEKSLYVLAIQLLTLIALTVAASARSIWQKQVWN